jgi:hypothetical protein
MRSRVPTEWIQAQADVKSAAERMEAARAAQAAAAAEYRAARDAHKAAWFAAIKNHRSKS